MDVPNQYQYQDTTFEDFIGSDQSQHRNFVGLDQSQRLTYPKLTDWYESTDVDLTPRLMTCTSCRKHSTNCLRFYITYTCEEAYQYDLCAECVSKIKIKVTKKLDKISYYYTLRSNMRCHYCDPILWTKSKCIGCPINFFSESYIKCKCGESIDGLRLCKNCIELLDPISFCHKCALNY